MKLRSTVLTMVAQLFAPHGETVRAMISPETRDVVRKQRVCAVDR